MSNPGCPWLRVSYSPWPVTASRALCFELGLLSLIICVSCSYYNLYNISSSIVFMSSLSDSGSAIPVFTGPICHSVYQPIFVMCLLSPMSLLYPPPLWVCHLMWHQLASQPECGTLSVTRQAPQLSCQWQFTNKISMYTCASTKGRHLLLSYPVLRAEWQYLCIFVFWLPMIWWNLKAYWPTATPICWSWFRTGKYEGIVTTK